MSGGSVAAGPGKECAPAAPPTRVCPTVSGRAHRELLHHSDGTPVDVMPLLRAEHADICAVVGSSAGVWNVPDPLGDDFVLMPHADPSRPLPAAFLKRGREVTLHEAGDGGWRVETFDHGALQSRGPERLIVELGRKALEAQWAVEGRTLSVQVGPRRVDLPLSRNDDPAALAQRVVAEIARSAR